MALKKRKSKLSDLFPERENLRVIPIAKKVQPTEKRSSSTNIYTGAR